MFINTELNVSVEPNLLEGLERLRPLLPNPLSTELARHISGSPPLIIPYSLLGAISQWSRTTEGDSRLRSNSINPQTYSIVSLLAGATTSPERKFSDFIPKKEPEELAAESARERKAITALVNGLVSVFAVAFAAWWAAGSSGWKIEWKMLFALSVGMVVAVSEAGLYLIWSSRRSTQRPRRNLRSSGDHKKSDVDSTSTKLVSESSVIEVSSKESANVELRQRR